MVTQIPKYNRVERRHALRSLWWFTFSPDHYLRNGRIVTGTPLEGGIQLRDYYVLLYAYDLDTAKALMNEAFGSGWAAVYDHVSGQRIVARHDLKPLFDPLFASDISQHDLCPCETPQRPHGPATHQQDGQE